MPLDAPLAAGVGRTGRARIAGVVGEHSAHELSLEILQEVVVEALRAEARFDPTRRPRAWLLGIANNIVLRHREKVFRQNKHESVASDVAATGRGSKADFNEEELFDRLIALCQASPEQEALAAMGIDDLLAQLTADERHIIELNVLHEMNAIEVGHTLGITPVNARVRLHRALTKLRAIGVEREAGREEKQSYE